MMQSSLSALCQAGVACPSNCSQSEWVLQHAYAFGNAGWAVAGLLLGSACQGRESCILSSACPALSVYGAHQVTMLHGTHSSTPACFACWVVNVASCLLPGKLLKPSMLCIDHSRSLLQMRVRTWQTLPLVVLCQPGCGRRPSPSLDGSWGPKTSGNALRSCCDICSCSWQRTMASWNTQM